MSELFPGDYLPTLNQIKLLIQTAKAQSLRAVNFEVISLYWEVGKLVLEKTESSKWGSGMIEALSKDIESEYSGISGFSPSNLYRMRAFYSEYKDNEKLALLTREISWTHNFTIMEMVKTPEQREFYIRLANSEGYSVKTLKSKIASNEFANRKQFQNNFDLTIQDEYRRNALTNQFRLAKVMLREYLES
jgi:predicted nuclease of restriction endonuclease-like (RecB) superfamily